MENLELISSEDLLRHWQGHRTLTRKTIALFPEDQLFTYSIGGMRVFADMVKELLAIAVPGLEEIVANDSKALEEGLPALKTKQDLLDAWDAATPKIDALFAKIQPERFHELHNLFGEYQFPIIQNILYFIDNEIHHRAQGFVYLRSLGIQPPFFWDR